MSPVQHFRQHLPNLLTLCNLALGFLSVVFAFENRLIFASWLILLAALFDFLDGFFAKLLGAVSEMGKQLDSLADVISFGMAPAAVVFKLMAGSNWADSIVKYRKYTRHLLLSTTFPAVSSITAPKKHNFLLTWL